MESGGRQWELSGPRILHQLQTHQEERDLACGYYSTVSVGGRKISSSPGKAQPMRDS